MVSSIKYDKAKSKLIAALMLAAAGYKVFPVDRNKRPLLKGWLQKAATDPAQIRTWFDCEDSSNIGVVTGRDSGPYGLFCFDVDGPEGLTCLEVLEKKYAPLERLCAAQTPSGGLHIFFRMPDGVDLRNSAGKLGRKLDTRGKGGYVVVAPSQVFNRQNILASYRWITKKTLADDARLPLPPGWMVELLTSKAPPTVIQRGVSTAYGQKALDEECGRIASASLGTRNDTLNKSAFACKSACKNDPLKGQIGT